MRAVVIDPDAMRAQALTTSLEAVGFQCAARVSWREAEDVLEPGERAPVMVWVAMQALDMETVLEVETLPEGVSVYLVHAASEARDVQVVGRLVSWQEIVSWPEERARVDAILADEVARILLASREGAQGASRASAKEAAQDVDALELGASSEEALDARSEAWLNWDGVAGARPSRGGAAAVAAEDGLVSDAVEASQHVRALISMPSLSEGRVEELSVTRLLYLLSIQRRSGRLSVWQGSTRCAVAFDKGLPVPRTRSNLEALASTFAWRTGSYEFSSGRAPSGASVNVYAVLMAGMRLHNPVNDIAQRFAALDSHYPVYTSLLTARASTYARLDSEIVETLQACDGQRTLGALPRAAPRVDAVFRALLFGWHTDAVLFFEHPCDAPVGVSYRLRPWSSEVAEALMATEGRRAKSRTVSTTGAQSWTQRKTAIAMSKLDNQDRIEIYDLEELLKAFSEKDPYLMFQLWEGCGARAIRARGEQLLARYAEARYAERAEPLRLVAQLLRQTIADIQVFLESREQGEVADRQMAGDIGVDGGLCSMSQLSDALAHAEGRPATSPSLPRVDPKVMSQPEAAAEASDEAVIAEEAREVLSELEAREAKLATRSTYDIFDLWEGCGRFEIEESYMMLVGQHHPDFYASYGVTQVKRAAERVFLLINKAYQTLMGLEKTDEPSRPRPGSRAQRASDGGARQRASERRSPSSRASSAERRSPASSPRRSSSERRAPSSRASSSERRAPSSERRAPSSERRGPTSRPRSSETRVPSSRPPVSSAGGASGFGRSRVKSVSQGSSGFGRRPRERTSSERSILSDDAKPRRPLDGLFSKALESKTEVRKEPSGRINPRSVRGSSPGLPTVSQRASQASEKTPEEHFKKGARYLENHAFEKASSAFARALEGADDHPVYRAYAAWSRYCAGTLGLKDTRSQLLELLNDREREPEELEMAHLFMGKLEAQHGESKVAIRHLKQALRVNRKNVEAQRELRVLESREREKTESRPSLFGRFFKDKKK